MKIISFIEEPEIIENILRHLNLWQTHNHDPPYQDSVHIPELTIDDPMCQIPVYDYWSE